MYGKSVIRTQPFLNLQLVIQRHTMCDLVLLLDEVQSFGHNRVVLELVLADLHEDLDHVLHALVDRAFMQDSAEALKNACRSLGRILREVCAGFAHERDGELDAVVGGLFEEQDENLKRDELMSNNLVDEVRNEHNGGVANDLKRDVSLVSMSQF